MFSVRCGRYFHNNPLLTDVLVSFEHRRPVENIHMSNVSEVGTSRGPYLVVVESTMQTKLKEEGSLLGQQKECFRHGRSHLSL